MLSGLHFWTYIKSVSCWEVNETPNSAHVCVVNEKPVPAAVFVWFSTEEKGLRWGETSGPAFAQKQEYSYMW